MRAAAAAVHAELPPIVRALNVAVEAFVGPRRGAVAPRRRGAAPGRVPAHRRAPRRHPRRDDGQQGKARLEAALEKRGLEPVTVAVFKVNDEDTSAQVKAAKAAGARGEGRCRRPGDPVTLRPTPLPV